jgi:hypothetical protein
MVSIGMLDTRLTTVAAGVVQQLAVNLWLGAGLEIPCQRGPPLASLIRTRSVAEFPRCRVALVQLLTVRRQPACKPEARASEVIIVHADVIVPHFEGDRLVAIPHDSEGLVPGGVPGRADALGLPALVANLVTSRRSSRGPIRQSVHRTN